MSGQALPAARSLARSPSRTGPGRRAARRPYRRLSKVGQWYARAYARRPGPDRFVRPELAEMVPPGFRAVVDRAEALAVFAELPGTAALRADAWQTRWAVWQALLEFMHDETGLIIVGQERLAELASRYRGRRVARSTAGTHLRALVAEWALQVEPGASAAALGTDRDRAPVYAVLAPLPPAPAEPVDEHGHLPEGSACARVGEITQPRKSEDFGHSEGSGAAPGGVPERAGPDRRERVWRYAARTGPERAVAVAWIAAVMGWSSDRSRFAALTDEELRRICSPFLAAGWSPEAIVRALHVRPGGARWPGPLPTPDQRDSGDPPRVRRLWAVLTWRLAAWRDPLGHPIAPPVEAQRPARGRPRKPPAAPASPVVPARGAAVEAELAAFRAANDQARARRRDAAHAREHRLAARRGPRPPPR